MRNLPWCIVRRAEIQMLRRENASLQRKLDECSTPRAWHATLNALDRANMRAEIAEELAATYAARLELARTAPAEV